jgi:phosphatidylglycerol:prolipoprotein diacylglycerol transferase
MAGFVAFVRKHKLPLLAMADLAAASMMIGLTFGRIGCLLNGCCYGGQTDWPWHVTFPQESPPYADQASRGELMGFKVESRGDVPAVISRVDPNSPASAAGLKPGDVVQSINGESVKSLTAARDAIFRAFSIRAPLELALADGRTVRMTGVEPPARSRPVHPTQVYSAIDAGLTGWFLWAFFPFRRRDGQCIALLLTIHPITRFLLEVIRTDEPAVFGTGLSISQNISIVLLAVAAGLWWYISRQPAGVTWPLVSAPASSTRTQATASRDSIQRRKVGKPSPRP